MHRGGKCIHILHGGFTKPADAQKLVIHAGCGEERLEFKLWSNGTLMHTKHNMCVRPINERTNAKVYQRISLECAGFIK